MRDFKSSLPLVIKVCGYLALALLSSLSISQEDFFSRLSDHTNLASAYADSGTTTDIMSFGNAKYNSNLVYNSSFELGMHGWAPVHPNPGINFDKEVFYHGTRALRLSSGQRIQSRFIKVSLDREYTISLFIKARHLNSQVHIGFIDGRCSGNRDRKAPNIDPQTEMGRKVSVTDQWNRYVLTKGLLTEQGQRRNGNTNHLPCHSPYYVVEIENIGPGDVWIDAVQVECETLSTYKLANEIEVGAEVADKPYNLFNKGEEVTIKGEAYVSPRLVGKNYVFIYDVYDYYGNRTNTYNHKLKASNSHLEDQLRIVLDKYGMMRVDVRIKDNANVVGGTAETAFGVLINVRNRQKYMQDAVFGMQASPNKATAELCQKIGVKWFRKMDFDYSPLFWDNVEKEKGKFNWEGIDETIDYMLDKKMLVTVPLTTTPKWARRNPDSRFSFPKDTNDYGNFVRAVVTRYKDKIKHWEIWNEPMNSPDWDPVEYFKLLREGYMAAKQADPDCTVIGGCLWTVQFTRELEKIFDLGGLDYMDIYSYHAYGTLERSLEQELDARALKGKVKDKYGRDLRVWMTEGGIVSWPFLPSVLGADVQSAPVPLFRYDKACEALARIYLKALAYGNEKFFYYYLGYPLAGHLFTDIGQVNTVMMEYDDTIKPIVLVHAVMADFLLDAKFVKIVENKYDFLKVFVYERDGRYLAAIWAEQNGIGEMRFESQAAKALEVKDIMGNRVQGINSEKAAIYKLGQEPLLIETKCDEQTLTNILTNALIRWTLKS